METASRVTVVIRLKRFLAKCTLVKDTLKKCLRMPRVTSLFVAGVAASAAAAAAAFVYLKKPISCPSQLWSCLPFSTTSSLFCEASKAVPALSPAEFRGFKVPLVLGFYELLDQVLFFL